MATIPDDTLAPARDAGVHHLSTDPGVISQLEQLHDLVLSVCPDCLVKQRKDEGLIYVPPERFEAARDKNLLTMWAEGTGVRMRIMPDPEEMYDASNRVDYLGRLQRLLAKMLTLGA
jgi:hypothetical protein